MLYSASWMAADRSNVVFLIFFSLSKQSPKGSMARNVVGAYSLERGQSRANLC